jgi:hypothetical protein
VAYSQIWQEQILPAAVSRPHCHYERIGVKGTKTIGTNKEPL